MDLESEVTHKMRCRQEKNKNDHHTNADPAEQLGRVYRPHDAEDRLRGRARRFAHGHQVGNGLGEALDRGHGHGHVHAHAHADRKG